MRRLAILTQFRIMITDPIQSMIGKTNSTKVKIEKEEAPMANPETKKTAIGVGAVVFRGDEVLLIKRGKDPFKGQWSIPGGGLEYGEKIVDAVIREVREETGCEITLIGLLDVFDGLPAKPEFGTHTVIIDYVAQWRSGEPIAGDDAVEAMFFPFDDALKRLQWDVTRQALNAAREIRDAAIAP